MVPKRSQKSQNAICLLQDQQYTVVIRRKYHEHQGCADCCDSFIWVVKPSNIIHLVHIGATSVPAYLVQENAASDKKFCVWLINTPVDLDNCWTGH